MNPIPIINQDACYFGLCLFLSWLPHLPAPCDFAAYQHITKQPNGYIKQFSYKVSQMLYLQRLYLATCNYWMVRPTCLQLSPHQPQVPSVVTSGQRSWSAIDSVPKRTQGAPVFSQKTVSPAPCLKRGAEATYRRDDYGGNLRKKAQYSFSLRQSDSYLFVFPKMFLNCLRLGCRHGYSESHKNAYLIQACGVMYEPRYKTPCQGHMECL